MPSNFPRLVYALEFLLAVVSVLELWSQVGGQGHLEMIPWYTKLGLTLGVALAAVMATVSTPSRPNQRASSRRRRCAHFTKARRR